MLIALIVCAVVFAVAGIGVAGVWRLGAPWRLIGHMAATIAVDALLGTVPLLGDVFDVGFKANRRNVEALRAWVAAHDADEAEE
jgi:hypothetical protein